MKNGQVKLKKSRIEWQLPDNYEDPLIHEWIKRINRENTCS